MTLREGPRASTGKAMAALCCWLATAASAGPAGASAWNRPAGQGLLIVDYTLGSGTDYFDGAGHLAPARSYSKQELAAYVEYGATDGITVIARPSLDDVHVGAPGSGVYRGLGSSAVGAQWQAMVFGPAVLAVQGTFALPGSRARSNPALVGNTEREGELRLLGGVALPLPLRPFLDLESSYRLRSGGAVPQWHGDLTLGFYPTDRLLLLVQAFTTADAGRAEGQPSRAHNTRLGPTAVYALTQSWAIEVGAFTTVLGRNALRDRGFSTGVWYYF